MPLRDKAMTRSILDEVFAKREEMDRFLPNGISLKSPEGVQEDLRVFADLLLADAMTKPTLKTLLLAEAVSAISEPNEEKRRATLLFVAGVVVGWIEILDGRRMETVENFIKEVAPSNE